jgi:hypothetical protein
MKKIIGLLIALQVLTACSNFAAGSYPYAEIYEVKANEAKIITAIEQFKKENPEYNVPPEVGLIDGRSDGKGDYWYHIYFYYKKDNAIVYSWLRPSEEGSTSFALVSINQGLELGNWKDINKDFSYGEDKFQKEKFKKLILSRILGYIE